MKLTWVVLTRSFYQRWLFESFLKSNSRFFHSQKTSALKIRTPSTARPPKSRLEVLSCQLQLTDNSRRKSRKQGHAAAFPGASLGQGRDGQSLTRTHQSRLTLKGAGRVERQQVLPSYGNCYILLFFFPERDTAAEIPSSSNFIYISL